MKISKFFLALISVVLMLSVSLPLTSSAAVGVGHWCLDPVDFNIYYNLMKYRSRATFDTSAVFTRAEAIYGISRIHGLNLTNSVTTGFSDVPSGHSYAGAIKWGHENELIGGYADGTFKPNNTITRQDLCVIFYRYCNKFGISLPTYRATPTFTDSSSISNYAAPAVTAMYRAEIVNGFNDGRFGPQENVISTAAAVMQTNLHALKNVPSGAISVYVKRLHSLEFIEGAKVFLFADEEQTYNLWPLSPATTVGGRATKTGLPSSKTYAINVYDDYYPAGFSTETVEVKRKYYFINLNETYSPYNQPISGFLKEYLWTHTNSCSHDEFYFSDFCDETYNRNSQNFGWRYNQKNGVNYLEFHQGLDISYSDAFPISSSTQVKNVFKGPATVTATGTDDASAGTYVQLYDGNTYVTYLHLSSRSVYTIGQTVPENAVIGTVGTTGNVALHLHISYSRNYEFGIPETAEEMSYFLDPLQFIY